MDTADPREGKLPVWARRELDRLRLRLRETRAELDTVRRYAAAPDDSDAILNPYSDYAAGLGWDPTVRFKMAAAVAPGERADVAWVNVHVDRYHRLEIMGGDSLIVLPVSTNLVRIEVRP
jgi:signal transduction protein with GAF and PtsI domain